MSTHNNQNRHLPTISSHSSSLVEFDNPVNKNNELSTGTNTTNKSKKNQEKRTRRTDRGDDDDDEDASICELSHENSQEQLNQHQNSRQIHKDPTSSVLPVASTATATAAATNLPFNADDFEKAFKRQMEQMLEGVDATEMVMMKAKQPLSTSSRNNSSNDVFAVSATATGQSHLPPLAESKNMKGSSTIQDRRALLLAKQQRKEAKLMALAAAAKASKSANHQKDNNNGDVANKNNNNNNDNDEGNNNDDFTDELKRDESLGSIVPINNTSSSSPRQQLLSVQTPQSENVKNNNNVPVSSAIALSNSSKKPSFVSGNIINNGNKIGSFPKKPSTSDFVPTASQSNDDNNTNTNNKNKQLTTSRRPSVVVFANDNEQTDNFSPDNNNNIRHQNASPISTNQNQMAINNENNHFSPSIVIPPQTASAMASSPTTTTAIKDIFEIEYGNSDFSSPSSFGCERVRELLHERADDEVFELIRKSKMKEEQEEEEYLRMGNDMTTTSGEELQQQKQELQIFSSSYARQNPQSRAHHHHNINNNHEGAGALSAVVAPVIRENGNNENGNHLGLTSNINLNKTDENGKKLTVAELKEKKRQLQIEETRRRVMMRTNSDAGSSAVTRSTMNNGNNSNNNNNNNTSSSSVASRQKQGKNAASSPNTRRAANASSDEDDDEIGDDDDEDEGKCCLCFDSIEDCLHAFTPSWASWVSFFWMVFLPAFFYVSWLGLFRASGQKVCEAGICVCSEGASVAYAFTIGLIVNLPRCVFFAILLEMIRKNRSDAPLRKVRVWLLAIMSVFVSIAVEAIVGTVTVSDAAYQAARYIAVILPTLVYGILKGNTLIGIGVSILAANPLATDLINPLFSRGGDTEKRDDAGGLRYLLLIWPFLMLVADRFVTHVLFMLLPTKLKLASSLAVSYIITSFFQMAVLVACFNIDSSWSGTRVLAVLYPIAVAVCEFLHSLHMVDVFFTTIFSYIQEWLSYLFEKGKELLAAFGVEGVSGIDDTSQANARSSRTTNNQKHQKNTKQVVAKSSKNGTSAAKNAQPSINGTTVSIPTSISITNQNESSRRRVDDKNSIDAFSLRSAATAGNSSISSANNNQAAAAKSAISNQSDKIKSTDNHSNSENSTSPTTMIAASINNNNESRTANSPVTPLIATTTTTTTTTAQTQKRIRPKFYTNDLRLMGTNCRLICLFLVAFVATLQLLIERYPKKYNFSTCQGEMKSTENLAFWWRNLGVVCTGQLVGQILATLVRWYQMRSETDGMLELMVKLKYAISFFPIPGRFLPLLTGMTIANVYVQVLLSIT